MSEETNAPRFEQPDPALYSPTKKGPVGNFFAPVCRIRRDLLDDLPADRDENTRSKRCPPPALPWPAQAQPLRGWARKVHRL